MNIKELVELLQLKTYNCQADAGGKEISSIYCGDLLSDVMAHIQPGSAWFTIQGHVNSVAVADLRDASCVVLVNGVIPDAQTIAKSEQQGVVLLGSHATSADLCMKLAGKI